jgi:hypothetical protein
MDEYQLSDLAQGQMSNFLTSFTVFVSIVTAYVVAAFAAGSRLTRLQLLTVNFCFLLSAGAIGLLSFFLFQRFLALVLSMQTLQTEVPQVPLIDFSWFIAALYVALVLGSLIFMTNVRRQRMGND